MRSKFQYEPSSQVISQKLNYLNVSSLKAFKIALLIFNNKFGNSFHK